MEEDLEEGLVEVNLSAEVPLVGFSHGKLEALPVLQVLVLDVDPIRMLIVQTGIYAIHPGVNDHVRDDAPNEAHGSCEGVEDEAEEACSAPPAQEQPRERDRDGELNHDKEDLRDDREDVSRNVNRHLV